MNIQTRLLKLIGGLWIVGLMAVPLVGLAEELDVTAKANTSGDFCTVINSDGFKTLLKFQKDFESLGILDDSEKQELENVENKPIDLFAKLNLGAMTETQKLKLLDAKSAIQAAVNLKSSDLQALMMEFRAVMNDNQPEHRAELDMKLADVKTSIDMAITKAKADCLKGVPSETVKADFQATMKTVHEKFSAERKAIQAETKAQVSTNIDTEIKVPEIKTIDQVQQADPAEQAQIGASFRNSIKSAWESFKSLFNKKAQ